MKCLEHDVIWIIKGNYDDTKYETPLDALRAYQSKLCGVDEKYITDSDILFKCLQPVMDKYFTTKHYQNILIERIHRRDVVWKRMWGDVDKELSSSYVPMVIIAEIFGLSIMDKNDAGEWTCIIDMDGYDPDNVLI